MHSMHMLGRQGDTETHWDPADPESVRTARRLFEQYKNARCLAFTIREPGGDAFQIRDFDPEAGEIVVTRPLVGG
jgi:hypothetical protein